MPHSQTKPWAKLHLSEEAYLSRKPWRSFGMNREQFEAKLMNGTVEYLDRIRIQSIATWTLSDCPPGDS